MRVAITLLALAACNDALDQRLAIVDAPRVLAIVSDPAEAKPGATVAFTAIVGGPDGPIAAAPSSRRSPAPTRSPGSSRRRFSKRRRSRSLHSTSLSAAAPARSSAARRPAVRTRRPRR